MNTLNTNAAKQLNENSRSVAYNTDNTIKAESISGFSVNNPALVADYAVNSTASVAGYTENGVAWQTEIVQAKTTHGPMDIRLWKQVK